MIFICDAMLGKLSKYFRILGLDTVYITSLPEFDKHKNEYEQPYFFTKRTPQKFSCENCIYIKSDNVIEQLKEVKHIIKPHISTKTLMNRCIKCNKVLCDIAKDDIERMVPEFIFHTYDIFKICTSCRKVYWEGSHIKHMREWVNSIA